MSRPPLVSSDEACAALERLGFRATRRASGGHDVIVVPLAKKEIARWTLKAMLRTGNVALEEFIAAL